MKKISDARFCCKNFTQAGPFPFFYRSSRINTTSEVLDKRLKFFTKDEINWGTYEFQDFYTKLIGFKKENPALWNGTYGGGNVESSTNNSEIDLILDLDNLLYKKEI